MGQQKRTVIKTTAVAPCGLNCRLCRAYNRAENPCGGCRCPDDNQKFGYCLTCKIKNCSQLAKKRLKFCSDCREFPCKNLKQLDKRYQTRYGVTIVDNLVQIKKYGVRYFVNKEHEKWACPCCAILLCMHKPRCVSCGYQWQEK
ncbi:MAG: DUF3795 domain-containing protein [Desulfobulbaceae bacterium]|nr:MAG: DUF3795 domain-containing protein [Desulfobulbaceae bacterium]